MTNINPLAIRLAIKMYSTGLLTLNKDLSDSKPYVLESNSTLRTTIIKTLMSFKAANLIGLPVTLKYANGITTNVSTKVIDTNTL